MHGSVEDTKLSTNKQHSLSLLVSCIVKKPGGQTLNTQWFKIKQENKIEWATQHTQELFNTDHGLSYVFLIITKSDYKKKKT